MQKSVSKREIELLQMRIDEAPSEARAEMQTQLHALMNNLAKQDHVRSLDEQAEDEKVEALFDNMPV